MIEPFNKELWGKEIDRYYRQQVEFLALFPSSFRKMKWYEAAWSRACWRFRSFREWLGEKIAGRSFSDDY